MCLIALTAAKTAPAQISITTEGYDNSRTDANLNETVLNTSNVNVTQFGKLFSYSVDGSIYAQPLYVPHVTINGAAHNVVYVATMNDVVYAFDADSNAGSNAYPLWTVDFRNPAAGIGPILSPGNIIADNIGIESTPVIDLTTNTMYLVSYTTESGQYVYRLHAMDITSGAEKFGGPVVLSGSVPGTGLGSSGGMLAFSPGQQMQRTALGLANGMVFITFGAFGDLYTYHGWVMAYNTQNLQQVGLNCITPNGHNGSIWASGRGPVVDSNNNVYFFTGDGDYDGVTEFGDSFMKYSTTNGTGFSVADWFTPYDFTTLDANNQDVGSSGPLMIPGTSLIVGGGKAGNLYVVDTTNMGRVWAGNSQIVQWWSLNSRIFTGPAFYNRTTGAGPWMYIWPIQGYLTAYQFSGTSFNITPVSRSAYTAQKGSYGAALAVSANGSTPGTGIVWASMPAGPNEYDGGVVSGIVRAFDASNLNLELWNSGMNSARDSFGLWGKFRSPLVVNGKLYVASVTDVNHSIGASLTVYGLLSSQQPPPNLGSSAQFLGRNTATQGNWQTSYGGDGYSLANSTQRIPAYAAFSAQNGQTWTWQSGSADSRALQIPAGGNIAACWYNAKVFQFNSNFTDGKTHELSLYLLDWDYQGRTETVQVVDQATNWVLDTENVANFGGGVYLSWNISGNVLITVTSTAGPNGVASGVFFGTAASTTALPETVTVNPTGVTLAANATQQFTAAVANAATQTVTWAIGSVVPAGANPGSFSNSTSGLYTAPASITAPTSVTITATSADATASASTTLSLTPPLAQSGASATFVKVDTTTQGNWQASYGSEGYALASVTTQSIPSYAAFAVQNQASWTWNANTTDARALAMPSGAGAVAATWYGLPFFDFAINFTDGASHQVALYAVDWDHQARSENIQIYDATTNDLLDTRTVSNFSGGDYLVWNISGSVKIVTTAVSGPNPVVSGVFFGEMASGAGSGVESVTVTPATVSLSAGGTQQFTAAVTNAPSQAVTWTVSSVAPSGTNAETFSIATVGLYTAPTTITAAQTVIVTATSADGTASSSATITLNPAAVGTGATATFLKKDTTTQGNWPGGYGADGYSLANVTPQSIPSYATFTVQNQLSWTWAQTSADPRALQMPASLGAIAAAWYGAATFHLDVNFADGNAHQLAIYALDWDNQGRSETIQALDASTGAVLDTETISGFSQGVYLVWNISGNVKIVITALTYPNAVVNGVFFGPGSGGGASAAPESITVNPTNTTLNAGAAQQFTAAVANAPSQAVTWTITSITPGGANGGSFSTTTPGLYEAPASVPVQETVMVTATSADNIATATATITLNPDAAPVGNSAAFVRKDTVTLGDWMGVYGADGDALAGVLTSNIPSYASFAVQNQMNYTWASSTSDPRALELPSGSGAIAATWYGFYGASAFSFDVNLTAGAVHQVSVYAVDWDNLSRSETFQIIDATTKAVLDTETISSFSGGVYLVWNISGHVTINVTVNSGINAVVSGVFFN